jgi:hypothetical protein
MRSKEIADMQHENTNQTGNSSASAVIEPSPYKTAIAAQIETSPIVHARPLTCWNIKPSSEIERE